MKAYATKYTYERVFQMWKDYVWKWGWSGETCGKCGKTANVIAGGPGWFCTCGDYNCQSWSGHQFPHNKPDMGPTRDMIRTAVRTLIIGFPDHPASRFFKAS